MRAALQEGLPDLPHISAMCCHNLLGESLPLFIIFKDLKNLPDELKIFEKSGDAWFASSKKGFMTRDLFFLWTIHFVNFLSTYRMRLDPELRSRRALLILDGHLSRECPRALMFMSHHNIDVLILPSHTTHILQIFDVSLASPLKTKFTHFFKKLINEDLDFPSKAAKLRYAAIAAIISAWKSVCNFENCNNGAKETGTRPCVSASEMNSVYIHELHGKALEKYQQRQLYIQTHHTIGGKKITDSDEIRRIMEHVSNTGIHGHLCLPLLKENGDLASYVENCNYFIKNFFNGVKLLSRLPPYLQSSGTICFFD